MSENIVIGNASQIQDDDLARDVNLQRTSPLSHKGMDILTRETESQYMGHIYAAAEVQNFSTQSVNNSSTETFKGGTQAVINKDMSSYIPEGLKKITKGVLVKIILKGRADKVKTQVGTTFDVGVMYSLAYNDVTTTRTIAFYAAQAHPVATNVLDMSSGIHIMGMIPFVFHNGVPYVVWRSYLYIYNMTSSNEGFSVDAQLTLLGLLS